MAKSSCTCRDLSPAPPGHGHGGVLEEIAHWGVGAPWTWDGQGIVGYERLGPYRTEGEVCQRNSGRIMCRVLDRCGVWACRLGDFMCPRHEYNKQWTGFRGLGDCDAAASLTARAAAPQTPRWRRFWRSIRGSNRTRRICHGVKRKSTLPCALEL